MIKAQMVCFGLEPVEAGWKAQKNPLCYGYTPLYFYFLTICTCLPPIHFPFVYIFSNPFSFSSNLTN